MRSSFTAGALFFDHDSPRQKCIRCVGDPMLIDGDDKIVHYFGPAVLVNFNGSGMVTAIEYVGVTKDRNWIAEVWRQEFRNSKYKYRDFRNSSGLVQFCTGRPPVEGPEFHAGDPYWQSEACDGALPPEDFLRKFKPSSRTFFLNCKDSTFMTGPDFGALHSILKRPVEVARTLLNAHAGHIGKWMKRGMRMITQESGKDRKQPIKVLKVQLAQFAFGLVAMNLKIRSIESESLIPVLSRDPGAQLCLQDPWTAAGVDPSDCDPSSPALAEVPAAPCHDVPEVTLAGVQDSQVPNNAGPILEAKAEQDQDPWAAFRRGPQAKASSAAPGWRKVAVAAKWRTAGTTSSSPDPPVSAPSSSGDSTTAGTTSFKASEGGRRSTLGLDKAQEDPWTASGMDPWGGSCGRVAARGKGMAGSMPASKVPSNIGECLQVAHTDSNPPWADQRVKMSWSAEGYGNEYLSLVQGELLSVRCAALDEGWAFGYSAKSKRYGYFPPTFASAKHVDTPSVPAADKSTPAEADPWSRPGGDPWSRESEEEQGLSPPPSPPPPPPPGPPPGPMYR